MLSTDIPRKGPREPSGFGVRVPGGVLSRRSRPVHTGPVATAGTVYGRFSRRRPRFSRTTARVALLVLSSLTYGALLAIGYGLALEIDRPNLATKGLAIAALVGVVVAVAWARRIIAARPKMSRREAESVLWVLTGLAEMQEHGLLHPDAGSQGLSSRGVTR